jgi:hypothetical protein
MFHNVGSLRYSPKFYDVTLCTDLRKLWISSIFQHEERQKIALTHDKHKSICYVVKVALGGLVVMVRAVGPKAGGFKPGRRRCIFKGDKNP